MAVTEQDRWAGAVVDVAHAALRTVEPMRGERLQRGSGAHLACISSSDTAARRGVMLRSVV
jgi:hypothetical protein